MNVPGWIDSSCELGFGYSSTNKSTCFTAYFILFSCVFSISHIFQISLSGIYYFVQKWPFLNCIGQIQVILLFAIKDFEAAVSHLIIVIQFSLIPHYYICFVCFNFFEIKSHDMCVRIHASVYIHDYAYTYAYTVTYSRIVYITRIIFICCIT